MTERFQIEDIIVQDASGVVFRAMDLETQKVVAVRRFFPFGANGGGLHPEEQTAYNIAVSRLAGLSHPALRAVICGGCDPVDGMPFIATEWIEGETLEVILRNGPLEAASALQLVTQALEVSELLSHLLAEEGVWVETELNTIVVGSEESGRGFTFWISPLKWLGGDHRSRGLDSIITLTEETMGWKGRIVSEQAGRGLGAWLRWLTAVSATTSLLEARESLAASVGAEPPPPAKVLVSKATTGRLVRPAVPIKPHSSKLPVMVACSLSLIVAGLGAFMWMRHNAPEPPTHLPEISKQAPIKSPSKPSAKSIPGPGIAGSVSITDSDESARRAAITRKSEEAQERFHQEQEELKEELKTQQAVAEKQGGVIQWNQNELIRENENQVVTLSGKPNLVEASGSGKTIYLIFGSKKDGEFFRAGMMRGSATADEVIGSLENFINKELKITGRVVKQQFGGNTHELKFEAPSDIEIID